MTRVELRRLEPAGATPADIAALAAVIAAAPAYHLAVEGKLPSASDAPGLLSDVPPGYTVHDKYFFGIYRGEVMIGCADVLRGWRHATQSMIGLLLFAEAFQGSGYGTLAYRRLEDMIRGWDGMESIRIGVIDTNRPALAFWRKMGFAETGEQPRSTQYLGATIILEKALR